MFGALRYNSVTKDVEHVELERADGFEARGYSRTACNECRLRKLKCSGDRNGCKRCRAICITCAYQPSSDNKSTFKVSRPSPSADNVDMATRSNAASASPGPQPRQQRAGGQGQQRANPGDKTLDHTSSGSGPHPNNGPSAAPDTPMELLYPLSPPPSNLDWDFSSADFEHMTDLDGTSSTAGDAPALSALVAAHEDLPQGMNVESGGDDYDIPDASVDLNPTTSHAASGGQYSMAITSKHHQHTASSPSFFAPSSKQGSKSQSWESFVDAAAPLLDPPPNAPASLDDILASLTRGMNVVEQVLRCGQCNAGTENRMLLATIAQQLALIGGETVASARRGWKTPVILRREDYAFGRVSSIGHAQQQRPGLQFFDHSITRKGHFPRSLQGGQSRDAIRDVVSRITLAHRATTRGSASGEGQDGFQCQGPEAIGG
ncbi:hypothetical protein PG997_014374 [Apiospora hydei]|uniref:Zn(2)-C6 fungal-type domain-containing protein n=1 Tax=Apiospora hydei TaxID=1337664 RepID=A0ABR1UTQ4_9PEZI